HPVRPLQGPGRVRAHLFGRVRQLVSTLTLQVRPERIGLLLDGRVVADVERVLCQALPEDIHRGRLPLGGDVVRLRTGLTAAVVPALALARGLAASGRIPRLAARLRAGLLCEG